MNTAPPEVDFFQHFYTNQDLPMDDPMSYFQALSGPTRSNSIPTLPNCFSQLAAPLPATSNNAIIDMEELFPSSGALARLTIDPYFTPPENACSSKGLPGCVDCNFNIANMLPQPLPKQEKGDATPKQTAHTPSIVNSNTILDYQKTDHLEQVFASAGIEIAISCHITYLAQKLMASASKSPARMTSLLDRYQSQGINHIYPATPSCIFSPSGLIVLANECFSELIGRSDFKEFCLYSIMDMAGILSILDMCKKAETHPHHAFGSCSLKGKTSLAKKCAFSLSSFCEQGHYWIICQFIPC
ncbi:hypothetical protein HDV03_000146 [Kappamyces sp. JEL0829]|nr:hypothetical protein HDV03_000146 [Kappamyces sp. JEL0829]